jgi:hypothetical protein
VLRFEVSDLIPPHVNRVTFTGLYFRLEVPPGVATTSGQRYLRLRLGDAVDLSFDLDAQGSHTHTFPVPPASRAVDGLASLSFTLASTPDDLKAGGVLNQEVIKNAALVLFYTGHPAQ